MKRKKNIEQKKKSSSSKNIKPDLWTRIGWKPERKLVSLQHREIYERRMKFQDGKGTHRSQGSNIRLKELATNW